MTQPPHRDSQYPEHPGYPQYTGAPQPSLAPAPPDLDTARTLWRWSAVLSVLALVPTAITLAGMRGTLAKEMLDQLRAGDKNADFTLAQMEQAVVVMIVIVVVLGAAIAGLVVFAADRMRRGKLGSRVLLTILGVLQIISAFGALLGAGLDRSGVTMAGDALNILEAVLAGGAIVLMHRPESNRYFRERRGAA
ncbi:MAG: hypothetical protein HOQ24_11665 [Mycobacteriaceae bacterium]|nr:hypothetical protein [Mycobacteriaceae bacterium]